MPDIVCLGELLIDLTQNEKADISQYCAYPGGAPANVAVAASRLGATTSFIGKVGADRFGDDLIKVLLDNLVDCSGVHHSSEAPTTLAVVSVDNLGERSFSFYRQGSADLQLTAQEALASLKHPFKILHIGSLSLVQEPARTATLEAIKYAKSHGALISYDPNYRESLWTDQDTAIFWMKYLLPMADIIKLSEEELVLLSGENCVTSGCKKIDSTQQKLIFVTAGENPTYYSYRGLTGFVPTTKIAPVDTNGAGDTFLGAVLSKLCERDSDILNKCDLEQIVAFANNAAAITCSGHGAIPAMPRKQDLN